MPKSSPSLFPFQSGGHFDPMRFNSPRVQQLGRPIARGNQFLVWATMIYRRVAQTGQVQIISKLTLILLHMLQTSKIILISYKPPTYSNFLNLTHMFCYLGKQLYGQACLTGQPRKKENCRSLNSPHSAIFFAVGNLVRCPLNPTCAICKIFFFFNPNLPAPMNFVPFGTMIFTFWHQSHKHNLHIICIFVFLFVS